MIQEIKHRYTGEVIYSVDLPSEFDTASLSKRLRQTIRFWETIKVSLSYANLSGADFYGISLAKGDFSNADLSHSNLRAAVLDGANFRNVDLTEASIDASSFSNADLRGVNFDYFGVIPSILNIDAAILAKIGTGHRLNMDNWHTCDTTHCRGGWAIHLAGKEGYRLQDKVGVAAAAALIYAASRPDKPVPDFYMTNEEALSDIRKCAAEQLAT